MDKKYDVTDFILMDGSFNPNEITKTCNTCEYFDVYCTKCRHANHSMTLTEENIEKGCDDWINVRK